MNGNQLQRLGVAISQMKRTLDNLEEARRNGDRFQESQLQRELEKSATEVWHSAATI